VYVVCAYRARASGFSCEVGLTLGSERFTWRNVVNTHTVSSISTVILMLGGIRDILIISTSVSVSPVPLPASFPLFAMAIIGLGMIGYYKARPFGRMIAG